MPCPNCGAALPQAVDEAAACPQCGAAITPAADALPSDNLDFSGSPSALSPARSRATALANPGTNNKMWIGIGAAAVGAIGLMVVLVLVFRGGKSTPNVAKENLPAANTTVAKSSTPRTPDGKKEPSPPEVLAAWKEFASPDGYLRVSMPGEPIAGAPSDKQSAWALETPTIVFLVQHSSFPENIRPAGEAPEPAVERLKTAAMMVRLLEKGSTVASEKTGLKLGEFPGYEIVVKTPTQGFYRARMYIAHGRLYQVFANGPAEAVASKDADRFFDSLAILKTMPDPVEPPKPLPLPTATLAHVKGREDLAELPDGRIVAEYQIASRFGSQPAMASFDPNTDRALVGYDISLLMSRPDRVAVSQDGSRLAAINFRARRLMFFEAATGKTLGVTELPFKDEERSHEAMLGFMTDGAGVVGVLHERCFVARIGDKTATETKLPIKLGKWVAYAPGPDLIVAAIPKKTERQAIVELPIDFDLHFASPSGKPAPAIISLDASDQVDRIAITPDGKYVALGYGGREQATMGVVTVANKKHIHLGPAGQSVGFPEKYECNSLSISFDGERIVGAFSTGFAAKTGQVLLSRRTGELVRAFQPADASQPLSVRFAPDGKTFRLYLFAGADQPPAPVVAYDAATGNPAPTEPLPSLRYQFKVGDKTKYVLEIDVEIVGFKATLDMKTHFDMTWRVTAVDKDGRANVTVTFDAVRAKSIGPAGAGEYDSVAPKPALDAAGQALARAGTALLGKDLTFQLDARGRVDAVKFSDELKKATANIPEGVNALTSEIEFLRTLAQLVPVLPPDGSTNRRWKDARELPWQGLEEFMTVSIATSYDAAGRRGVNEKFVFKHALTPKPKPNSPATIKILEQSIGGTCLFDSTMGRIRESTFGGDLGINISDGKESESFNIQSRTTLRVVEP